MEPGSSGPKHPPLFKFLSPSVSLRLPYRDPSVSGWIRPSDSLALSSMSLDGLAGCWLVWVWSRITCVCWSCFWPSPSSTLETTRSSLCDQAGNSHVLASPQPMTIDSSTKWCRVEPITEYSSRCYSPTPETAHTPLQCRAMYEADKSHATMLVLLFFSFLPSYANFTPWPRRFVPWAWVSARPASLPSSR